MAGGIRWQGADPAAAAHALEQAKADVVDTLQRVVREVPEALRQTFPDAARSTLPRGGGLAGIVAAADLSVVEDASGERVGSPSRASGTTRG